MAEANTIEVEIGVFHFLSDTGVGKYVSTFCDNTSNHKFGKFLPLTSRAVFDILHTMKTHNRI